MVHALLLILGLALLIGGADLLVRGVSALARAAGVSPLIVGLTIVAFGTSLPETVINTLAAYHGETGLAFGNIVGSCAINIGFVLAVSALIKPLRVETSIVTREIPMMLLAVAALLVLSADLFLDGPGARAAPNALDRSDGIILLLLFCVFIYYIVKDSLISRRRADIRHDPVVQALQGNIDTGKGVGAMAGRRPSLLRSWLMTLAGLIGVASGGRITVAAAVAIAEAMGVSQVIIGLTLVSFGTTLPELATGVLASRRGQSDLAIGNVVGSNIFNVLFIGGIVATIRPIPVPAGGFVDLLFMAGLCVLLLPVAIRGPLRITRAEGAVLLVGYLSYVVWRATSGAT